MSSDLPEWAAPLTAGPIVLDADTPAETLSAALEERLAALLRLYGCDPTPEGWKDLALRLALEHRVADTPIMEVRTPVDREPGSGGRPIDPKQQRWVHAVRREMRADPSLTAKAAAAKVKKNHKDAPSGARLQNILADSKRAPRPLLPRLTWEARINDALSEAAIRLERSRK